MSYQEGFEDATELCLSEITEAKDVQDAKKRLFSIISLIKEEKFERLKRMLYDIGRSQ